MSDPKNLTTLTGRLVADPEVKGSVINFRMAVDYAGSEKDSDDKSGYFNVKFFTNDDTRNAKFVASQVEKQNFAKGTAVQVSGRLVHERWVTDDGKRSTVVLYADGMTYAARPAPANGDTAGTASSAEVNTPLPDKF